MILNDLITPTRNFNLLYIILDSLFVIFFLILLIIKKRYQTVLFSLFGGILYLIVDYGYFYLISGSRIITINGIEQGNLNTFLILLWMSLSYGITNFAFIWLCLRKDQHLKEWLFLIISWWLVVPSISTLGGNNNIQTFRTTSQYHSFMAIILICGYFSLIIYNLMNKNKKRISILKLNLIGISVQFCWEFALLVNGIRPMNDNSLTTIIVNSLIETNLGMPIILPIYLFINKYFNEDLTRKNIDKKLN